MKPPTTREEMWCYLNMERRNYLDRGSLSHPRACGCYDSGAAGTCAGESWPVTFTWDPAANAGAQKEAERVAAGGTPAGENLNAPFYRHMPIWIDCEATSYTVTSTNDYLDYWPNYETLPHTSGGCMAGGRTDYVSACPAISSASALTRINLYYHDAAPGEMIGRRAGIGLVEDDKKRRTWIIQLLP